MDAVVVYGTPLINDLHRFGAVSAVGLDETLFARVGPYLWQPWSQNAMPRDRRRPSPSRPLAVPRDAWPTTSSGHAPHRAMTGETAPEVPRGGLRRREKVPASRCRATFPLSVGKGLPGT